MINKLIYKDEQRNKLAFHASDVFKSNIDLYFAFSGEERTNPPQWYETLKWGAGSAVEAQMLKILKMNGIVKEDYDQREHGRIDITREGIEIHGYIDAKTINGIPIEIKSINNANKFDILKYQKGQPRDSYVGQLSVYMDALGVDTGYLFVASIDGLHHFWLECNRIRDRIFKCGSVEIDLDKEYKRWASIKRHVDSNTLPDEYIWEYVYKKPVNELDWTQVPASSISKARNGQKVIGDWQILWSPWKDKIIELQGTTLGYTDEELSIVKQKTQGYTTWKKQSSNPEE